MTSKKFGYLVLFMYFTLFLSSQSVSFADNAEVDLPEISQKLGTKINLDLKFINDENEIKTLREMFNGESTLIITLNYFRCTTMCTYQFLNMAEAFQKVNVPVGKGYSIASISFDPLDNSSKSQSTRKMWLKNLGTPNAPWRFYTSSNTAPIKELTESLNFFYEIDDEGNYAHTAGLFFIDREGTLKRYLYGIVYEPRDIKYALIDTSNGKVGSIFDKFLRKFSKYNATRGRYEFYGS